MSDGDNDLKTGASIILWTTLSVVLAPFAFFYWVLDIIQALINTPARQEAKLQELHKQLYLAATKQRQISNIEMVKVVTDGVFGQAVHDPVPPPLFQEVIDSVLVIHKAENFLVPKPPSVANSIEGARYRDTLSKLKDPQPAVNALVESFQNLKALIPQPDQGVVFDMKLRALLNAQILEGLIFPFYRFEGYFPETRTQLTRQLHVMSDVPYTYENINSPKLVMPTQYKGTKPISGYIENTPLENILNAAVPFTIPDEKRFEHCHIVGGSGSGKTQLLQHILCHDFTTDRSIVVVDSQSDLIRNISHLDLPKDPIIISPRDLPSFNIFDVPDRVTDDQIREQIANGVIDTYMYVFDGILGADLTAKQGVFFKLVARLLLNVKPTLGRNATIRDMFDLMENIEPYRPAIEKLPDISRSFFEKDFNTTTYKQTKEQIRYRLNAILENPTMARLFTCENNALDFYELLQEPQTVILIDTAKDFLKSNSSYFGRFFISLIFRAILERASSSYRHPAYLFVDEAAEYFDKNIDDMLTTVRKYRLGCVFAHQFLDQCAAGLRSSFAANTGIKLASGVSTNDARNLAGDMRTTHDFILAQPKLTFACHIRGMKAATAVTVDAGRMERQPQRDDYAELLERNRARVSGQRSKTGEALETSNEAQSADGGEPQAGSVAANNEGDW